MNVGNLFNQAVNISSAFLRILQEDADLDSSYSLNIAQIEQRYKSKISELDLKKKPKDFKRLCTGSVCPDEYSGCTKRTFRS